MLLPIFDPAGQTAGTGEAGTLITGASEVEAGGGGILVELSGVIGVVWTTVELELLHPVARGETLAVS